MSTYREAFAGLNAAQKQAVTTIEGPVLVIAGPGTGKTQLLSVRVAYILEHTDTLPQNILCLTFTENGAENMRERLTRFIGQDAYNVHIGTYHSFGGELIKRFPEAFTDTRLQAPADDLTRRQILQGIVDTLAYDNPLKQLRHHLGDLISTISEVKRGLLTAEDLRAIADENSAFILSANLAVQDSFAGLTSMVGGVKKVLPAFEALHAALQPLVPARAVHPQFSPLAVLAEAELAAAIASAGEGKGSTKPLTIWKDAWLAKDSQNRFVFDGALQTRRIRALADVFEAYESALLAGGWYDFDDMILRSIRALEEFPDLRFSLQEQYLYILLDEFQDTNAAQLRLVQLLSDNPVSEGRPNVLAVGDDDQAIYAFQGAQYSNMLDFYHMYRDTTVVNLTENYRSARDILTTARAVARQIDARLEAHFDINKELVAANPKLPEKARLDRREFLSDVAQYDWIARHIKELVDSGTSPSEIAVLAPRHKQLEPLVPYLAALDVPIRYEKRENILEAPVVKQLITMSKLVIAVHTQDNGRAGALWPQVLSFPFWNIPVSELWQLSWRVNDSARTDERIAWSEALLTAESPTLRIAALLFLSLAGRVETDGLEQLLDALIGSEEVVTNEPDHMYVRSPLRAFYTGEDVQKTNPELFYDTLSHLTVLRARLRDHQQTQADVLRLPDFIRFVEMYEAAEERLLNTSPYNQQADAVQLMTVYKAKGLEFEHVFLPSLQDDVWGASSRGNSNKLTLPANLAPIRHAGATDDERLRILFVALTRAKIGLHLLSFAKTYSGRDTRHLKYLNEQQQPDGSFKSLVLPEHAQTVVQSDHQAPGLESLELNWRQRHLEARGNTSLHGLLQSRLERYQLSPTHLTHFLDLEYGGPDAFFFDTILRFPHAPSVDSQFGSAIHEALEWMQQRVNEQGSLPEQAAVTQYFAGRLNRAHLDNNQFDVQKNRGERALRMYLERRGQTLKKGDKAEHNFSNEGVFVDDVRLGGKVDRMEINREDRTITVIDYKTGRSYSKWERELKLHKYKLQLYCYKLLIEGSASYKGYRVPGGRIEFVEPDNDGQIHFLEVTFDETETARVKKLLAAMWQLVHSLSFPDINQYPADLRGVEAFEADLVTKV
jgi:DNA helicase II / ATP-dependent DNA helicase PcrA